MMGDTRIWFAIVYLLVDVSYVVLSKQQYAQVTHRIQGRDFPNFTGTRIIAAILSYTFLVLGWLVFATGLADRMRSLPYHPLLTGFAAGATYGLVVYGVFNGTLHTMFKEWDLQISLRDMLWGTLWSGTATALYNVFVATKI